MKIILLIFGILGSLNIVFSQEIPPKMMILNSMMSCKPDDYSTFMTIQRGYEAIGARQYPKALKNFELAKEKDPDACDAWYAAAYVYNYQGNYERALANSKESVKLNSSYLPGYTALGYSFLNLREYDSAVKTFRKVIDLAPELVDGYYGLAYTHFRKKEFNNALSYIRLASNIVHFEKKRLEILEGKILYLSNNLKAAKKLLLEHKGRLLGDGEACYFIGELYLKDGNTKKAEQFKSKALKLGYLQTE